MRRKGWRRRRREQKSARCGQMEMAAAAAEKEPLFHSGNGVLYRDWLKSGP